MLVLTQNADFREYWEASDSRHVAGQLIAQVIQQALGGTVPKVTIRADERDSRWIVTISTTTKPRDAAEESVRSAWEKANGIIRTHGDLCSVVGNTTSTERQLQALREQIQSRRDADERLEQRVFTLETVADAINYKQADLSAHEMRIAALENRLAGLDRELSGLSEIVEKLRHTG